jgi:hypothetical protein
VDVKQPLLDERVVVSERGGLGLGVSGRVNALLAGREVVDVDLVKVLLNPFDGLRGTQRR